MIKRQRGALSLLWCAVAMAVLSLAAMTALMSMRYEKNYFAQAWTKVKGAVGAAPALASVPKLPAGVSAQADAAIRKCTIDGKVVYSNVECAAVGTDSQVVKIHDTRGFEAPKVPVAAEPEQTQEDKMRQKLIDKATGVQ